ERDERDQEAGGRAGCRDEELFTGAAWLAFEVRNAAEDEERDRRDVQAAAARDQRVCQFVDKNGAEQEDGSKRANHPVGGGRPILVLCREEPGGERPSDEDEDDQPRRVNLNVDPGDASYAETAAEHVRNATGTGRALPAA